MPINYNKKKKKKQKKGLCAHDEEIIRYKAKKSSGRSQTKHIS